MCPFSVALLLSQFKVLYAAYQVQPTTDLIKDNDSHQISSQRCMQKLVKLDGCVFVVMNRHHQGNGMGSIWRSLFINVIRVALEKLDNSNCCYLCYRKLQSVLPQSVELSSRIDSDEAGILNLYHRKGHQDKSEYTKTEVY